MRGGGSALACSSLSFRRPAMTNWARRDRLLSCSAPKGATNIVTDSGPRVEEFFQGLREHAGKQEVWSVATGTRRRVVRTPSWYPPTAGRAGQWRANELCRTVVAHCHSREVGSGAADPRRSADERQPMRGGAVVDSKRPGCRGSTCLAAAGRLSCCDSGHASAPASSRTGFENQQVVPYGGN